MLEIRNVGLSAILLWLPGGCYGGVIFEYAETDAGSDAGSGGDTAGDTDDGGVPGVGACEGGPGRVGLQRLTRSEYNRTVRDLFGVTSAPADAFPPDSTTKGFENNAKSLTVSPALAGVLFDAAETVAAEAIANRGPELIDCTAGDTPCIRQALGDVALRVYRRPPSSGEVDDLLAVHDYATSEGESPTVGMEYAIQAMLMAPQFLYRGVPAPGAAAGTPGDIVALDDYAVASRLSYFLWGSTPDDELLARAAEGALTDDAGLRAEFDRMLADPKADALYEDFFRQWMQLGRLGSAAPDPDAFPQWSDALRDEMMEETRRFFADLMARDASPLEIVTSTETFANDSLAEIYGVPGVDGSSLEPVNTDPTQRAGVLTMPAVLAMTSGPEQPNIVWRGVWLAETILCAEPPPPPEGVPLSEDPLPGETERERLARHRSDPACASCHQLIDPLGFALEHYDALGAWRISAQGKPVDSVGELPDGTPFDGAVELAQLLADGAYFPECVTEKTMTYALGRVTSADDACVVEAIGSHVVAPDGTMSELLWAVVQSEAFRTQVAAEGDQ